MAEQRRARTGSADAMSHYRAVSAADIPANERPVLLAGEPEEANKGE